MLVKIQTSLNKLPDSELLSKGGYILASMAGNAGFPNPYPALADVKSALDRFETDLAAASGRDLILVAVKNQSRSALLDLFTRLGYHILSVAYGDTPLLASSGYSLVKAPETINITHPENISVRNGLCSGQIVCRVKRIKEIRLYKFEITTGSPETGPEWVSTRSSKCSHLFTGLQPGTRYWFRVAAIWRNEMAYSQTASLHAQ